MAHLLSATDLAIALAMKGGSLRIVERASRFGDTFFAIEDACGVIEVQMDRVALDARIAAIREAAR
jgi:hypothetical protein